MEVGNDKGMEQAMNTGLGFQSNGAPTSSQLELFPQAPLYHASASLVPLSVAQKSSTADDQSEMCSQNSIDLNRSPSVSCYSNGQYDLQKDFKVRNGLLRISNDQEEVKGVRRKLRLSEEQYAHLEQCFQETAAVNNIQKEALAKQLNISPRQVQVWFQNRRARSKMKQKELDSKLWKRSYRSLREENKRLQKELLEAKAVKQAAETPSPSSMGFPAAPLVMCPSCQRVFSTHNTTQFTTTTSKQHCNPSKDFWATC